MRDLLLLFSLVSLGYPCFDLIVKSTDAWDFVEICFFFIKQTHLEAWLQDFRGLEVRTTILFFM